MSYHVIIMYYLNYEHTGLQTVLPLLHSCYSSCYLPIVANDLLTQKSHPYAYFRVEEKGGYIGRTISYQLSASVMI